MRYSELQKCAPEFWRSSCERPTEGNRKERHKVINVRGELHEIQIQILIRIQKIKGKPNNYTRSPQVLKKPADLMEHKRTKKEQAHFFMFYTSGSISEGVRKMGNWLDSQWLLYPRCLGAGTIASRAICCCLQMKTSSFCQHASETSQTVTSSEIISPLIYPFRQSHTISALYKGTLVR